MRYILGVLALLIAGCVTDYSGTGKVLSGSICEWELHGGRVAPYSDEFYCWAEKKFKMNDQYIYQVLPVDCRAAWACAEWLDLYILDPVE